MSKTLNHEGESRHCFLAVFNGNQRATNVLVPYNMGVSRNFLICIWSASLAHGKDASRLSLQGL